MVFKYACGNDFFRGTITAGRAREVVEEVVLQAEEVVVDQFYQRKIVFQVNPHPLEM
jgi:hypothetical protein